MMVPNKLFEYVALGTPAISSSLAGIRDYFDERSLLFFAPGDDAQLADRIRTLRSRPDHASSMVRQAETIYEAHRWTREQAIYYAQHEAVS
jgi:glycosyltransferase involved in cell wall biosynthesis